MPQREALHFRCAECVKTVVDEHFDSKSAVLTKAILDQTGLHVKICTENHHFLKDLSCTVCVCIEKDGKVIENFSIPSKAYGELKHLIYNECQSTTNVDCPVSLTDFENINLKVQTRYENF